MREGPVEQLRAPLLHVGERLPGPLRLPPRRLELLLRRLEPALGALEALDGPHVGRHGLELVLERDDLALEVVLHFVVKILRQSA